MRVMKRSSLGRVASRPVDADGLAVDAARVDDLQVAAGLDDGHPVDLEDRQEGPVGLGGGDRPGGGDGGLDAPGLAREDEALAGDPGDHPHQVRQVRVLEGEVHARARADPAPAAVLVAEAEGADLPGGAGRILGGAVGTADLRGAIAVLGDREADPREHHGGGGEENRQGESKAHGRAEVSGCCSRGSGPALGVRS
jgi:hypothetical protein